MKIPSSNVEDLKPLTSLRFVAALMIVFFHGTAYFSWPWLSYVTISFATGVSFFFVLSGFILTHVYTSKGFPGYAAFLRARFARLWPVHVFALIVLVVFVGLDSVADGSGIFSKWATLPVNLTLTQALIPYPAYAYCWNTVSWSISTEAVFYLAFPLLLINIRRTWHWKLLGSVLLALLLLAGMKTLSLPYDSDFHTISMHSASVTNPLIRGIEFCIGMATWAIWHRYIKDSKLSIPSWSLLELIAVLIAVLWITLCFDALRNQIPPSLGSLLFDFSGSSLPFAILIATLASGRGLIGRLLSYRPFVFLGEISFSIYMLHEILMRYFANRLPGVTISPQIFFTTLFVVASGSYLMVEKPAQRFLMMRRGNRIGFSGGRVSTDDNMS